MSPKTTKTVIKLGHKPKPLFEIRESIKYLHNAWECIIGYIKMLVFIKRNMVKCALNFIKGGPKTEKCLLLKTVTCHLHTY